jgi:hypothetical protein
VIFVLLFCIMAWTVDRIRPIGSLPLIYATHSFALIAIFLLSDREIKNIGVAFDVGFNFLNHNRGKRS